MKIFIASRRGHYQISRCLNKKLAAKYKKYIYSRKAKLNEKKLCTPINPKKYSCYGLKLKFMKEFDNEKKFRGTKIPHPPPHNSSNGPSLIDKTSLRDPQCPAFL